MQPIDRTAAYRPNVPHVIAEVLEGELIILNFETGTYYNVGGSGADVWAMIEAGRSCAEIARGLAAVDAAGTADRIIVDFVSELVAEGLIVAADGPARTDDGAARPGAPFTAPSLHKHTDLQELLLLDPIHDVDEAGWPHRPD